jgi:transposase
LPDLPPWSTVYRWFAVWRDACLFEKINHALVSFWLTAGRIACCEFGPVETHSKKPKTKETIVSTTPA